MSYSESCTLQGLVRAYGPCGEIVRTVEQDKTGLGHAVERSLSPPSRQARPITRFKHKRGLTGQRSGESGRRRAPQKTVGKAQVRGGKCQVEVRVTRSKNEEQGTMRILETDSSAAVAGCGWSQIMLRFLNCETEKSSRSARKAKIELVVC